MYYYQTKIQYDGTGYCGFQWQKDIPTIQNEFNLAIKKTIEGKFTTMGASRTDTGVHAMEQIVKISSHNAIDCDMFLKAVNSYLPSQIYCDEISPCSGDFRPASDPLSKEYHYFFTNQKIIGENDTRYIANISQNIDIDLMMKTLETIIGTHDFKNFCSAGSNVKSTVREIYSSSLQLVKTESIFQESIIFKNNNNPIECYQIKINGNGFLKQMIRHLVSALWTVGTKRISINEFNDYLKSVDNKKKLWKAAPACGLFLYKIIYPNFGNKQIKLPVQT